VWIGVGCGRLTICSVADSGLSNAETSCLLTKFYVQSYANTYIHSDSSEIDKCKSGSSIFVVYNV
jgi:hypothetical protein